MASELRARHFPHITRTGTTSRNAAKIRAEREVGDRLDALHHPAIVLWGDSRAERRADGYGAAVATASAGRSR